jgi:hypothetical protein
VRPVACTQECVQNISSVFLSSVAQGD